MDGSPSRSKGQSGADQPPDVTIASSTSPHASIISSPSSSTSSTFSPSSSPPAPCPCPCGGPLYACRLLTCPTSPHLVMVVPPSGVPRLEFLGTSDAEGYREHQRWQQEEVANTLKVASERLKTLQERDVHVDDVRSVPTGFASQATCKTSSAGGVSPSGPSMRFSAQAIIGWTDRTQNASVFDDGSASYSKLARQGVCRSHESNAPVLEHCDSDARTPAQVRNETTGAGAHPPTARTTPASRAPSIYWDAPGNGPSDSESAIAARRRIETGAAGSTVETTSKTDEPHSDSAASEATVTESGRKKRVMTDALNATSRAADTAGWEQEETKISTLPPKPSSPSNSHLTSTERSSNRKRKRDAG